MFIFALLGIVLSLAWNKRLKDDLDELLESIDYIDKYRLEKANRCAMGNNIEDVITSEDIFNFLKRNWICFVPAVNYLLVMLTYFKWGIYYNNSEEFYRRKVEKMSEKGLIVPCSKEEYEHVKAIEDELVKIRKQKITDFFTNLGEDEEAEEEDKKGHEKVEDPIMEEETLEIKEEELKEDLTDKSTIEINIKTPFGDKKYYRVIDSRKREEKVDPEDEALDKIMGYLDRIFDAADRKIDKAMESVDKKADQAFDAADLAFDKLDKKIDKVEQKADAAIDRIDEATDKALEKVDKALEKILKL